jgi:hypothetical protein
MSITLDVYNKEKIEPLFFRHFRVTEYFLVSTTEIKQAKNHYNLQKIVQNCNNKEETLEIPNTFSLNCEAPTPPVR